MNNPTQHGLPQACNAPPTSAIRKILRRTSQIFSSKPKTRSTIPERTNSLPTTWTTSTNTFSRFNSEPRQQNSLPEEPFKQQVTTCIVPITLLSYLADLPGYQLASVSPALQVHTVVSHVVVHTPPKVLCQQMELSTQTTPVLSQSPCTTSPLNHTLYDPEIELLNLYSNVTLPRKSDKRNT